MKKSCYKRHCAQLKTLCFFFKSNLIKNKIRSLVTSYLRVFLWTPYHYPRQPLLSVLRYGLMANFADQFFSKLGACLDTFIDSQLAVNLSLYNIEKLNLLTL